MKVWNPWHGCHKKSAGCLNCYMFRRDAMYEKDSNIISKTKDFNLGTKKHRDGSFYLEAKDNPIYVCLTSDFFLEEADQWRPLIWQQIKARPELEFCIITKRIERFLECIPEDWKDGYDNVTICATCETQKISDERIPYLLQYPIKKREIIHEPMLEQISIAKYLKSGKIKQVTCGGESGDNARICDYEWILKIRQECIDNNTNFYFKQTGANFKKAGKIFHIERKKQMQQADKANINYEGDKNGN